MFPAHPTLNERFEELDDDELWDLHDESEDSEFRERIAAELERRKQERRDNPVRPWHTALWVLAIFGLLAVLIAIVATR